MSTVLREEMVNRPSLSDAGDDPSASVSPSKRAQKLEILASKFTTDYNCITVNDDAYLYNGKYYSKASDGVVNKMLHMSYDKTLLSGDRSEVLKFIKLKTFVEPMELNKNWNEIVVKNGILNLSNLELYPHNSSVYNTVCVHYDWNPKVTYSPIIDSFMNQISAGDEQKKKFLYEIVGYTLLRKPVFGKMFILYGGGGTGKSTFLNLIKKLIGEEYCSYLTLSDMEKEFLPAEMFGKLVNLGDDIDAKILKDTGMLKSVITGETVTVHRKFEAPFNFNNFAKLIFTCNKLPAINDRTTGLYRRISIIEINKKIEKFDPFFLFKITDEDMQYLLYNAVKELRNALENNRLSEDSGMIKRLNDFKNEQSSVLQFSEDTGISTTANMSPVQTVYDLYVEYCKRSGFKSLSKPNFSSEFCDEYGYEVKNTTKGGKDQCRRFVKKT
jgi:putative DNA primase/helicase